MFLCVFVCFLRLLFKTYDGLALMRGGGGGLGFCGSGAPRAAGPPGGDGRRGEGRPLRGEP